MGKKMQRNALKFMFYNNKMNLRNAQRLIEARINLARFSKIEQNQSFQSYRLLPIKIIVFFRSWDIKFGSLFTLF